MFWRVPNEMEQRKELIGFYIFMRMETILSNFMRIDSFTASLVLQIVMWCNRDAKELLAPEKNYFLVITPAPQSLVIVSYLDDKMSMFSPIHPTVQTMACATFFFFLHLFSSGEEAETGRAEVFNGYMVCHFRAHDFSPHHSTRRRSWTSWNCIAKRE